MRAAEGDLEGALSLLKEAEQRYTGDFSPNVRPVAAWIARLWVTQGRLGEALDWVRAQGLAVDDELSYLREFQHLTLVRVLLARSQAERDDEALGDVLRLLERLQQAAVAGGRAGSVIECLMLQALAHQAQGSLAAALVPLERALALAEPAGYFRLFVDEGPPMARLLERLKADGGRMKPYARDLLPAFGTEAATQPSALSHLPPASHGDQPLLEPLSQRELEVLRLFKADLSGPEIAAELVIALSTLRTHTKRIYSKLNVNSRRAAVTRATELGLL